MPKESPAMQEETGAVKAPKVVAHFVIDPKPKPPPKKWNGCVGFVDGYIGDYSPPPSPTPSPKAATPTAKCSAKSKAMPSSSKVAEVAPVKAKAGAKAKAKAGAKAKGKDAKKKDSKTKGSKNVKTKDSKDAKTKDSKDGKTKGAVNPAKDTKKGKGDKAKVHVFFEKKGRIINCSVRSTSQRRATVCTVGCTGNRLQRVTMLLLLLKLPAKSVIGRDYEEPMVTE